MLEKSNSSYSTYILLAITAAIWGVQPSCIKWLRMEWTSETIVVCRYAIVSFILLAMAYRRAPEDFMPTDRREWLSLLGMGLTGIFLNNVLQFNGIPYTTVTNSALISSTTPTITAILAIFLIKERLSLLAACGVLLSFGGVVSIISHGSLEIIRSLSFNYGDVLCLTSQVAWALFSIISISVLKRMSVVCASGWAGLFGCLITLGYTICNDSFHPVVLSTPALLSFLYTTLLGGLFALLVWNNGVKAIGAGTASIFLNIMPVAGMIAGVTLFGEVIGIPESIGTIAILTGVYLTTHFNS